MLDAILVCGAALPCARASGVVERVERVELATYDDVYMATLQNGVRVQYEIEAKTNFVAASGEISNIEWFNKDSFNAKLHGDREYFAFSDITPNFVGINSSWPFHVSSDCTFETRFFEVRLFKSPGKTSGKLTCSMIPTKSC